MKARHIPKCCHHRASGLAYVTDPATRKEEYFGPHGTPAANAAYDAWVVAFLARPDARQAPAAPAAGTVASVILAYLPHAKARYRKRGKPTDTISNLKSALRWAEREGLYAVPAAELAPRHLRGLARALAAAGRSVRTVNCYCGRLRTMMRWAADKGLVPEDVADRLESARGLARRAGARVTAPVLPPPPGAVERTLPKLPEKARAIVALLRVSGMRPGEACALRARDVDDSAEPWRVTVSDDWNKTTHRGRRRVVHLGPQARAVLAPWLAAARARGPDAPLFPTRTARHAGRATWGHYTSETLGCLVRRACRAAGAPRWAPGQLRHEAGSAVHAAEGWEAARTFLGHGDVRTTRTYVLEDEAMARRTAEKLG
jgi:integrase